MAHSYQFMSYKKLIILFCWLACCRTAADGEERAHAMTSQKRAVNKIDVDEWWIDEWMDGWMNASMQVCSFYFQITRKCRCSSSSSNNSSNDGLNLFFISFHTHRLRITRARATPWALDVYVCKHWIRNFYGYLWKLCRRTLGELFLF